MSERTIRNKNLRSPLTVIEEMPDLSKLGNAGVRMQLDLMLTSVHGQPARAWQALTREEKVVLRKMAAEDDPAWGLSHRLSAIGVLGELQDRGALAQLIELAQEHRADVRLQMAATNALGRIGTDPVRPVLRRLLEARRPEVRAQAAIALARSGSAADLAPLVELARRDRTFARENASRATELLRGRLNMR